jgi:hypothetical protein
LIFPPHHFDSLNISESKSSSDPSHGIRTQDEEDEETGNIRNDIILLLDSRAAKDDDDDDEKFVYSQASCRCDDDTNLAPPTMSLGNLFL